MGESLAALVGARRSVLVDEVRPGSSGSGQETGFAVGRLASQAPEIDGVVFLRTAGDGPGPAPAPGPDLAVGDLVPVEITGVRGVDLEARPAPSC